MAQMYDMPPDTNEKEKVIGGFLTAGQGIIIASGAFIALILVLFTFKLLKIYSLILGIPPIAIAVFLAVTEKKGMPIVQYMWLKAKYKKKIKYYINKRS